MVQFVLAPWADLCRIQNFLKGFSHLQRYWPNGWINLETVLLFHNALFKNCQGFALIPLNMNFRNREW